MKVAANKDHYLHRGWFAVKNRSVQERRDGYDLERRNLSEQAFFSLDPWNKIGAGRVGLPALRDFLADMVQDMLQENINTLVQTILSTAETRTHSRFTSISSRHTIDEKQDSFDHLHPVHERISEVDESGSDTDEVDLEAGGPKKRPTMLINSVSVALTVTIVLTLIGLGCQQLAQEVATDLSCVRLLLLVTAPPQIFVSLVSHCPRSRPRDQLV